jgi:ribosomal protein S14
MQSDSPAQTTRVELKYCERCGGLNLRAHGSSQRFCRACLRRLADEDAQHAEMRAPGRPTCEPEPGPPSRPDVARDGADITGGAQ